MYERIITAKMKYPERAIAWINYWYDGILDNIDPKYNLYIVHIFENILNTDPYFTERERRFYKKYIVDEMTQVDVAENEGLSKSRVREIINKTGRKLRCKNIRNTVSQKIYIVNIQDEESIALRNYTLPIISASPEYNYRRIKFNEYLLDKINPKTKVVSIRDIIEKMNRNNISIEQLFSDIDIDNAEYLNQYFMDHPYLDPDDCNDRVPKTLFIDINEVLRRKESKGLIKKNLKCMALDALRNIDYGEIYTDEIYRCELTEKNCLHPSVYKSFEYPDNLIMFLLDSGVIDKYDIRAFGDNDKELARRFIKTIDVVLIGSDLPNIAYDAFVNGNCSNIPDDFYYALRDKIKERLTVIKLNVIGKTTGVYAMFLRNFSRQYNKYKDYPFDTNLFKMKSTKKIDKMIYRKGPMTYGDFVEKVINYEITSADVDNDIASVTILNTILAHVPYVSEYALDSTSPYNGVAFGSLKITTEKGKKRDKIDIYEMKKPYARKYEDEFLKADTYVYNLKVLNEDIVRDLKSAGINTTASLIRAAIDGFNFCSLLSISLPDCLNIYIYVSNLLGNLMIIDYDD